MSISFDHRVLRRSISILLVISLCLSMFPLYVYAESEENYCNGTDMYSNGEVEFFINIDDEDKLYRTDLSDGSISLVLEEHIISIVCGNSSLYLLAYREGNTVLIEFNLESEKSVDLTEFSGIVSNVAYRDEVLYYLSDGCINSYHLLDGTKDILIDTGNVNLFYFIDYNTMRYYVDIDTANTYHFDTHSTEKNVEKRENAVKTASSYSPRLTAPATDNPYYTTWNIFHQCGYGMAPNIGNCTCYAFGRSYENLGSEPKLSHGDAGQWYDYNRNNNYYSYGKTPALGAVAVWKSSGAGHVAVVEVIDGDTVTTSESGWQSFYFKTVTRSASNPNFSASSYYSFQGFIYVLGTNVSEEQTPDMWCENINLPESIGCGFDFELTGEVCSNCGINWYALVILDSNKNVVQNFQEVGIGSYENHSINTLAESLDFSSLPVGNYTLSVEGGDLSGSGKYHNIYSNEFEVVNPRMRCENVNLPDAIACGSEFQLTGDLCGNNGIRWFALVIYDSEKKVVQNVQEAVGTYGRHSINNLAQSLDFSALPAGSYTLSVESMDYNSNERYFSAYKKSFVVDSERKMWCEDINLPDSIVFDQNFHLTGDLCGNNGIRWFALVIYDSEKKVVQNVQEAVGIYGRHSINNLAMSLDFSTLPVGTYKLSVESMDNDSNYFGAYEKYFSVVCTNHNYVENVTEPTCTAQGYTTHTCTACGDSYKDSYTAALGHNYSYKVTATPTTSAAGTLTGTCSRCNETATITLPALNTTDYNYEILQEPSATAEGIARYTWKVTTYGTFYFDAEISDKPLLHVSNVNGAAGSSVTVEIALMNNPGIVSAYLDLNYDTTKLTLTNVEDTELLTGALFGNDYAAIPFALNWDDSLADTNNTANGVIAKLTFRIKEDCPEGSIPITLSYHDGNIIDKDLNSVDFLTVEGSVEVVDFVLGDVDGDGKILAKDVAALRRHLAHWTDATIVEAAADVNKDGRVTAVDVAVLRRYLAHWTGVTLSAAPMTQTATRGVPHRGAEAPTIAISSVVGNVGDQITLDVDLLNNPGIVSAYLDLSYDSSKLKLVSVEDTKLLNGALFSNDYTILPFALNWDDSIASANNTKSGTIAKLTFEILGGCEDGPATVSISYTDGNILDFDLNNVDFAVETGTVSVHTHQYTTVVTEPTCTEQGYTTHTCTACGDSYKDSYTAALGHNYSYKVTTAPTTTATGTLTGTCSRCSSTTTVTLPKLNTTDYSYSVVKEATCTATGTGRYTWKTTTYGSYYFDVTLAKTSHNYTAKVTAPTCTEQGYTTHTCTVCGDSYKDSYTAALGHNYSYKVTTAPTTSATGTLTGTCSRCSGTTTVTLPKLNATDYSYSVIKEATCTATGTGRYTWKTTTYGSYYFDVTLAKTSHNYTAKVTAPTCTEQGYTTHTCTACGDSYIDTYVDALGHTWDNGVVTVEPTETKEGVKTFTCTRCGTTKTEPIPVLTHTHSYTAVVTAPTCTDKGYTTHTCECGDSYKDTYVDALGHAYGEWTQTKAPSCTEKGEEKRTCSRCDASETREIAALGHDYKDGVCTRCGEKDPNAAPPVAYTDVSEKAWYYDAVQYATKNGLMNGVGGNRFDPNGGMTRAMLITVLWRYEGQPMGYENKFTDVNAKSGSWYIDAVAWAAENGIVNGIGNNKFDPNGKITREQMAAILFRYANKKSIETSKRGELNSFPDANKVSSWAKDAVQWTVAEGIINGSDGKLLPKGNATRAQVATILMRFIENIVKK